MRKKKLQILLISFLLIYLVKPAYASQHTDLTIKATAIEALGNIGEASSVKVISTYVDAKEFLLQTSAIDALAKIASPEAYSLLRQKLTSLNKRLTIQIAGILSEKEDVVAESIFESAFKDTDILIRMQALETAITMSLTKSIPKLIPLLNDSNDSVILRAIEAISTLSPKNEQANDITASMINHPNSPIRNSAVAALGLSGNKKYIPILKNKLSDENDAVIASAKLALAKLEGERASRRKKYLQLPAIDMDKNSPLYIVNILIAAEFSDFSAIPQIIEDIKSLESKTYLRIKAISALKKLKDKLKSGLIADSARYRKLKAYKDYLDIRIEIGNKTVTKFFIAALKDKNSPYHKDAPLILAAWQDSNASSALLEALGDDKESSEFRSGIIYALGILGEKSAAREIEQLITKKQ